jgi:hypothetical protein
MTNGVTGSDEKLIQTYLAYKRCEPITSIIHISVTFFQVVMLALALTAYNSPD